MKNRDLTSLTPSLVWKHFAEIVRIPRPSHHEEKIRRYIAYFAEAHGLEYRIDEANNVWVSKPATPGMENRKGIIMQAHLDMVPQKNNDKAFDFENDPIDAFIDGEWVTADGTTLGADNGIGVAAALAVLEDDTLVHGPVEALFTATEETGMVGAFGLRGGLLRGDILLNLDSETEGELYVGCAGGLDANIVLPYQPVAVPQEYETFELSVKGFKGGHSGIQIGCQRGNANRLLFRLLLNMPDCVMLCSVDGGGLRNAIPREATAVIAAPADNIEQLKTIVSEFSNEIFAEFAGIEDGMSVHIATTAVRHETAIPNEVAARLARAVAGAQNGVIKMSVEMEGLVQTSSNLARVVSDGEKITVQCLLRSSVNSEKHALGQAIKGVFELAGATVALEGDYDGWKPNMDSPILRAMLESYRSLFGVQPAVTAIHAGLECGIIGGTYPNLDMISFGPTICYPHSPDEKVNIASVDKFYRFLLHTLENAPLK